MYGWENAGLMSPWANAWGMQPQTIADTVVRGQVAPALGVRSDSDGRGYSAPGRENSGPQTPDSQQRSREVMGQLGGYAAGKLGNTAMGAIGATAAGFSPGIGDVVSAGVRSLADPMGVAGLGSRVAAQQMGFSGFQPGFARTAVGAINPVVGGLLSTVNPALGLAYGLLSPFAMDALADGLNTRKDESYKDAMEDEHGFFGGRSVAKDIAGMMDRAGFDSMAHGYGNQGYGPADAARGMTNKDASSVARGGNPMGNTYGANRSVGFANAIGGPRGGASAVDSGYGPSMGGFAGLGIGNPSSYGGRTSSSSGSSGGNGPGGRGSSGGGGYGGHAGGKDGSGTGFGR